jgi:arylsulfatase A-like enzyme
MPEELYPTTYVAEPTIARLEEYAKDRERPFFLQCSFPDPHHPFTPPGRYWDMYRASEMPLPSSWHVDPNDVPPHVRHLFAERDSGKAVKNSPALFACSEAEVRPLIALTYGMITMIDDAVARILAALERSGRADDTIVIFTSDHGDLMGDHQLMLKGPVHYEGVIRVPFIWQDVKDRRVHGRRDGLAATIDLPTTILDRAGIKPVNGMLGLSQLAVIAGGKPSQRDAVLIEEEGQRTYMGFASRIRMRTLITRQHRLSLYEGVEWAELYDRAADPNEMRNLWGRPEAAAVERAMIEQMAREMLAWSETSPAPTGLA